MKFADRLKVTANGTSAAALTLGAAAANCRTLAQAIASGDLAVGDTGVPFTVDDGAGNWEDSYFTLASSTQLTRERVYRSSNNGAAVTFSGATLTVFNNAFGDALGSGLLDPNDVGFDIVLCAGQSNMEGNPAWDPLIDIGDPRVWQWSNYSGDASYRQIITGADPLYMPNGVRTGKTGPATWFAKAYLSTIPQNRKVLLVPVAVGSTAMVGSVWQPGNPGGTYYERAISDTNLAVTAAQAMYPNSRVVGVLWAQGEADGVSTANPIPQWQYAMNLKALIAGFRSRITGAANSWFIISSMTPEGIAAHTGETGIDLAHKQVAAEVDRCAFVSPVSGMAADVHYTAPGIRIMGSRMGLAAVAAKRAVGKDTTAPVIVAAIVGNGTPSIVNLTLSEVLDATAAPAGSAFAITGHAVTSASISGNLMSLSLATPFAGGEVLNVAYTQPGTNPVKDTAGNLLASGATFAITNNVAASDTTAPIVSGTPVIADAAPNVITITFNEALAAGNPPTSAFTVTGTQASIASVAVSGSTVNLTMGANYVAGNTASVSYTPSGTNDLQDAAGNKVLAFGPVAVTNNATGTGVAYATMSPTDKDSSITISGGNLVATGTVAGFRSARANTGKSSGKWYWEAKVTAGTSVMVGFGASTVALNNFAGFDSQGDSVGYYSSGTIYNLNANQGSKAAYTTNDVIGIALDMTGRTMEFFKNGVSQGQMAFPSNFNDVTTAYPMVTTNANGAQLTMNFGATAFAYTPPAGYSGLTA